MEPEEIHAVVLDFIHLLEEGGGDEPANLRSLELCLDRLALACHSAHPELDCEEDAPTEDYLRIRQLAAARFPKLSFYYEASKITDASREPEVLLEDGLDDVADIARDLYAVLWYWDHDCRKTALWQFRWGYEIHWGAHLRSLQKYLYELRYG